MKEILLTQNQVALVDDEDYENLSMYRWYAVKQKHRFYTVRSTPRPNRYRIYLHHEILKGKPESGFEVDHIDGNGLNNQKNNLRIVTRSQNAMNQRPTIGSSGFKGIYWKSSCKLYLLVY